MIEQRFTVGLAGGRARLLYNGNPVHLSGPAHHCILEGYPDVTAEQRVNLSDGFNYVRHWCFDYGMALYAMDLNNSAANRAKAQLRAYPYSYNTSTKKWDVATLNPAYVTWLQGQLSLARDNGVVILISLFSNQDFRIGAGFGWEVCPWNPKNNVNNNLFQPAPAPPGNNDSSFYWRQFIREPKIGPNLAQDEARQRAIMDYVNAMVGITSGYWNVFFEICNEPQATLGNTEEYLPFCDLVAKQIHLAAGGKRMILYNPLPNGSDFDAWMSHTRLLNWPRVNGVVFHGINPETFHPDNYGFKRKVFQQLSSDAYRVMEGGQLLRDRKDKNTAWANRLAPLDVDFEAYTFAPGCRGVLEAAPANRPTKLV